MEFIKKAVGFAIGFAVVSGAIYLIGGGDKLEPFEPYHCDEGRFSASFPGPPQRKLQTLSTPAGDIDLVMFSAGSKKTGFIVAYSDYPERIVQSGNAEKMLDGARDGAVRNVRGKLVDETAFDYYGRPAREIEIDVPRAPTVRARLILIGNRLYQVMAISPSMRVLDEKGPEFFASFSVDGIE